MAGTTPPPPSSAPPGGYGPPSQPPWGTDYGPRAPQPPYPSGKSGKRGLTVLVLSVVLTLMIGGGAFAFVTIDPFHLFRSGPQASEALPANAVFYAGLDLDPTASQKIDALRFLNHFPAFRDSAGLTDANADIADQVVGKAIDKLNCAGVEYAGDVKPWLGDRFGLAVMPSTAQRGVPVVFAVQVSDDDAAKAGIQALNACDAATASTPTGNAMGVSFVNGFMLLAETQAQADTYARSAARHSLADDPHFTADLSSLGDLGVATMWVDIAGALKSYAGDLPAGTGLDGVTSGAGRMAATFRFASDHVEVATSLFADATPVEHVVNPVVRLPESTVFAMSMSGGDQRIASSWPKTLAQLRKGDPAIDQQINVFETRTGLSLPTDLETLFGHNLLLALDQQGLTAAGLSGHSMSTLNFGARFTNDPAKLNALYDKVTALVRQSTGGNIALSKKDVVDGIAIASNDAYADSLAKLNGHLGDSEAFTSVVDDGASQDFVLFFNVDAVKGPLLQAMRDAGASQQAIDNIRPLKAFGMAADVGGDYQHLTMRLAVDE
jgi:Protein of unknown function (DUF3352)